MIVFPHFSSMALLSWNLNGYRSHFEEVLLLLVDHNPLFLCLQETHLLPEHHLRLRGYVCYRKDIVDVLRAHGGVAILVHDSIHSQEIALQSTLRVVAVKVTITHLSFIVCSLYLPPAQPLSATDLFDLFSKLPTPSSSLVTSMPTIHSGALVSPVRELHLLSNSFLLLIPFF